VLVKGAGIVTSAAKFTDFSPALRTH
jgi:hypothetical protein